MAGSDKNDFGAVAVSKSLLGRLEDTSERLLETFLLAFTVFQGTSGPSKSVIPYSTSSKNRLFTVSASNTCLLRIFEAFGRGWGRLQGLFRRSSGVHFVMLMGGAVSKL